MADTIYYVDAAAADDTGNGLGWTTAKKTIGGAWTAAKAVATTSGSSHHTIKVKPGSYDELITIADAGTTASNVWFVGYKADGVTAVTDPKNDADCPSLTSSNANGVLYNNWAATVKSVGFYGFRMAPTHNGSTLTTFTYSGNGTTAGDLSLIVDHCYLTQPATATERGLIYTGAGTGGNGTKTLTFTNNVVECPKRASLDLVNWSAITVTGNTVTGQTGTVGNLVAFSGTTTATAGAITVSNNTYTGCEGIIIALGQAYPTVTISGNTLATTLRAIECHQYATTVVCTNNTVTLTGTNFAGYGLAVGDVNDTNSGSYHPVGKATIAGNKVITTGQHSNHSGHVAFIGHGTRGTVAYNRFVDLSALGFGLVVKGDSLSVCHNECIGFTAFYFVSARHCLVAHNTARCNAASGGQAFAFAVTASSTQRPTGNLVAHNLFEVIQSNTLGAAMSILPGASAANCSIGAGDVDMYATVDFNTYVVGSGNSVPFQMYYYGDATDTATIAALRTRWTTIGQSAYNDLNSTLTNTAPLFIDGTNGDLRLWPGSVGLENQATPAPGVGVWGALPTRRR